MKNVIVLIASLVSFSLLASESSLFKCAGNVDELSNLAQEYEQKYDKEMEMPFGLFQHNDDFLGKSNIRFYTNMEGEMAMFMTTDSFAAQAQVHICTYEDRTFLYELEEKDYGEYYFEGKSLMLSDEGVDQENPEDRSRLRYLELRRAHVVELK